ncbi:hypothetical protein JIP62_05065 [Brevundimonas vitis]|uniref:asparagine synthase (glutamine-hydrolyzing) n=1 Tax=Brevundimonas vitisensis TaxID=2800818 RepID=A0ABX7BRV1_9CAUL|nr:asparagine synthase-related protein [Brevundimonas vitisensis]QQQ19468.1 hypothetical protein JIP62_05065 [Brevundimonas vitisensis]
MGICGRVNLDPSAPTPIDRPLASITITDPRSRDVWYGPGVTLASVDEASTAVGPGDRAAVFDGRIDNRDDLRRALGIDDLHRRSTADIALLAFEAWGDDFCDRIIGDFACAIWDGQRRRLVMATDPAALRTLYYWTGPNEIRFANEQRGLWADGDVPRQIDEEALAAWLCLIPRPPHTSFFKDIFSVPPGARSIWEGNAVRTETWWKPENLPYLNLATEAEYEEAMRAALIEAVACRIGDGERIGSMLSGGLDSSTVTALAARHLAEQGRGLTSFTATPVHKAKVSPKRFADEWDHAAALAAMYPNIDHVRVPNEGETIVDALESREAGMDWPLLNPTNMVWINGIHKACRDRRLNVLLAGSMGNLTMSWTGAELLTQRLKAMDMVGAARVALDQNRHGGMNWTTIAANVGDSFLPVPLMKRVRRLFDKSRPELETYSAIDSEFLVASGLDEHARKVAGSMRNLAVGDSRAIRLLALSRSSHRGTMHTGTLRRYGVDQRDPTSDRRVVELSLSIPEHQFQRRGVQRALLRDTMRGMLPEVIRTEQRRGLQAADWRHGFDKAMPQLISDVERLRHSPLASRALDLDRMSALLEKWPGPGEDSRVGEHDYKLVIGRAVAAGRFVRRIEGGNA